MTVASIETGWHLHDPRWLWLLAALPLLAAWRQWRRPGVRFAAAVDAQPPLPRSWRVRFAWLPSALDAAALVLAVVALARPVALVPLPPEREGRDVVLCIDHSSSMAADDLAAGTTRLAVGAATAGAFVDARRDDRIGLVEFARYADLRCPPTLDHGAVGTMLAAVAPVAKDGPEDATGIGGAVAAAAAVLQRSLAKGKVVVLLTDGEENVATADQPNEIAPLHAAQLCRELGIRVHTIVVGLGNQKADGRFVPLDTTAVEQLAATTRGRSFAVRDEGALRAVWAEIDALEATAFAEPRTLRRDGFAVLLGIALATAFAAHALARTKLRVLG